MSTFSRVISRPFPSKQGSPFSNSRETPEIPRAPWEQLPNITIMTLPPYVSLQERNECAETKMSPFYSRAAAVADREAVSDIPTRHLPRLFTLARTESIGSMPSLCHDDWTTESTLSSSPPLPSPCSPPLTGCSTIAVLGSPGCMSSFPDEQSCRDANAELLARMQLQWSRGFGRNDPLEEESTEHATDGATTVPVGPAGMQAANSAPERVSTSQHAGEACSATRAHRLGQRVQTPPPLNTRAIHVETLLAKLHRGSYSVQVGHIDGSDVDSGCEADDEVEWSFAVGGKTKKRGRRGPLTTAASLLTELKTTVGVGHLQRPQKKTYAAVAVSPPKANEGHQVQRPAVITTTSDWTSMFERRGPLVEVGDA
ncbi:hypothetical protein C2E23DRAFT_829218 [Lenzites betulinus]|nr:hypothetical protein C2E23DRAFT_829218 [Lenzites betulinus]